MRKNLQREGRLCDIGAALADITARRPALTDIATSLALLLRARLDAAAALPAAPILDISIDAATLAKGEPLLAPLFATFAQPDAELLARFITAARIVLPAAAQAFPKLAPELAKVAVLLDNKPDDDKSGGAALAAQLLAAIGPEAEFAKTPQTIEDIAGRLSVSAPALHMCATETLLALLSHEARALEDKVDQDAWRRGYCPVCGGGPDVGILKEGKEESEFLVSKAGQLWLHCGQCGTLWRFPRLRCVVCGCEHPERTELLVVKDDPRQDVERAHLCQDCRSYLITVNMVDRVDRVNLEMLPIGLLHLDVLAQQRGFQPVAPSPWNSLS